MSRPGQTIIIRKSKKVAHAHHGGAWKIAYADFVTAMMAFFLLLWLISMTTPEQKQGLADYFAPPNVSPSTSGAGGTMGGTALDRTGAQMAGSSASALGGVAMTGDTEQFIAIDRANTGNDGSQGGARDADRNSAVDISAATPQVFHSAAASIRQAWQAMPELTEYSDSLIVEETEEGLDIQILDQIGRPMFRENTKFPYEHTRLAISAIAPVLQRLSNQIRITGHAAAGAMYVDPHYGPWELTADRANVVRGILGEFGLSNDRIYSVVGRGTAEPFFANDPYMAANERVRITVLNALPPVPPGMRY